MQVGAAREAADGKPSAGPIYRKPASANGFFKLEVDTLFALFARSAEKFADNKVRMRGLALRSFLQGWPVWEERQNERTLHRLRSGPCIGYGQDPASSAD